MSDFDHHRRIAALVAAFKEKHVLTERREGGKLVAVSWEPKQ